MHFTKWLQTFFRSETRPVTNLSMSSLLRAPHYTPKDPPPIKTDPIAEETLRLLAAYSAAPADLIPHLTTTIRELDTDIARFNAELTRLLSIQRFKP